MTPSRRSLALPSVLAIAIGFSACGAESDPSADDAAEVVPEVAPETVATSPEVTTVADDAALVAEAEAEDDDHAEDDHADDDATTTLTRTTPTSTRVMNPTATKTTATTARHGDEDHDDHGDEDHDDHGDEDHDDHGDEDHDDHDHESGGLGAHEHGTAELSVAWIDAEVSIELVSPTFNVFGFEYEPTTEEDLAIEADRTATLTTPDVIAINDEAGCSLTEPAETEVERDGSHSEITVSWVYDCENADEIAEVDASGLFAEFANFEDVDAQWVSESEQSSAELTPSAATLSLR